MKKVIFICMLSISMCLSVPATDLPAKNSPALPSQQTPSPTETTLPAKVDSSPEKGAPAKLNTSAENVAPTSQTVKTTETALPAAHNETANNAVAPPAATKDPKETSSDNKTAPTTESPAAVTEKKQQVTDKTTTVAPTEAKPKNDTATDKDAKANATTGVVTPSTTPAPSLQARAFDGPSFIGGMILTLGLLAIGFMGFKYYKNQTERNYHTL